MESIMDDFSQTEHLLAQDDVVAGAVDYKGRPALRSKSGRWKSVILIIGVEVVERISYNGIGTNLITYLTGPLRQPTLEAAVNVNAWFGTAYLLPLLGGLLADSCVGRHRMILGATLLYVLGLGLMSVSATAPALRPQKCEETLLTSCPAPSSFQLFFFFTSLYLVALAEGGHRPCVQAFGADQFDPDDPQESSSRTSFFNRWYFGLHAGTGVTFVTVTFVQENVSWGLGFGIPCFAMVLALCFFLLGTPIYRHTTRENQSSAIMIAAIATFTRIKQKISSSSRVTCSTCSLDEVQPKSPTVSKLVYIWATCLVYAVVYAQISTFFVKQGSTMDRRIFNTQIQIPSATLQILISLCVMILIPIYDQLIVPFIRRYTKLPSGLTMLRRISIGIFFSVLSMVAAALVERRRLAVARAGELAGDVPMIVWWLTPQYVLFGISDVFAMVGLQEFFYDQMPDEFRSVGVALYVSIFGIGSWISGFLISVIDKITTAQGRRWFPRNLNQGHLDYFYWMLAGFSAIELSLLMYLANSYVYRAKNRPSIS